MSHSLILLFALARMGYQYALNTPAEFPTQHQHQHHPLPLPVTDGSQLTRHEFNHNTIDPVLCPLPDNPDLDLTDPVVIAEAHGYAATSKTAGARRKVHSAKAKGKENSGVQPTKRTCEIMADDDDDADVRVKRGRPSGSNNYTTADAKALLDFIEKELPLGQRGWQVVHANSIETKFKQPTGDGVCPPDVTRAHQIDALINERAGTCDLNDADYDNNHDDDDTHSVSPEPDEPQHVAVTKATHTKAPVPRHNARGDAAAELLTYLSGAFDPATQRAHDEERADRSLANTQLMTQAQQLRDVQTRIDALHVQVFDLRSKLYDSQHACDKAELCVEMLQAQTLGSGGWYHRKMCLPPPKRKSMIHEHYPDGGQSLRWLTDEEFLLYDNSSIDKDLHVGGPACNARAARRRMSASHCMAMHRSQAAKDAIVVDDEPASAMHRKDGTPEV
ncbi:hypothetical protein BDR05DRAFT_1004929 [Suillus weaverae]|nr:hypothetical protein BDR05DRAFT_1004929 [Suillus weaverae]